MNCLRVGAIIAIGLALSGCAGLTKDLSRQEKYLLGGGALGATILSITTVGAPGATTAVIGGAVLGVAAGYALETYTRPPPPGSSPAGRTDAEARLREINRLRDANLITTQEYENRRRFILESL